MVLCRSGKRHRSFWIFPKDSRWRTKKDICTATLNRKICSLEKNAVSYGSMAELMLGKAGARTTGAVYLFKNYAKFFLMIYDLIIDPFVEFSFMRRSLMGCFSIALGASPVGVFLMLRRMSLTGDAIAHAILPGAAIGYLISGLSLTAMTLGGLVAGMIVVLLTGLVTRNTILREDTSLASFYLISLALGVLIVTLRGTNVNLMHILF